jgi:hypothetical protein
VTTAPLFRRGQAVTLAGDGSPRVVHADAAGRITFTVDLGPAHVYEQDTPAASGQTFVHRKVRFDRER